MALDAPAGARVTRLETRLRQIEARLDAQLATLDAGGVPDNFLRPAALGRLDRELLRDALRVVKAFQQHVRGVFHLTD